MIPTQQQDPELSSRLKKSNDELRQLANSVETGMIDVKVLMDFRTASERARQASMAVQLWLESQGKGNDPYQVMNEVMRQRVQMTTQLVKDVTPRSGSSRSRLRYSWTSGPQPVRANFGRTVE